MLLKEGKGVQKKKDKEEYQVGGVKEEKRH